MAPGKHLKKGKLRTWWGEVGMMDRILLLLGVFLLVFITAMTVVFCVKGETPDMLIQYTLGAGGVEAMLLAGIKVSKVLAGEREEL